MTARRGGRRAREAVRIRTDHALAELVEDADRPGGWTMLVDGTPQSHVDLTDPTHLEFEYVRRLGHLVDLLAAPHRPLRVLHLGGGAWTLARYVAATRPGSAQQVVDHDGGLVELVRSRLPLDDAGVEIRVGDARAELARLPAGSADLVVVDVFAGARTPAHLTSLEFVREAARMLAPGGCYAANVADSVPLRFARAQVATAGAVFPELALVASPKILHGPRFGNLVLLGSAAPLPLAGLARAAAADLFPARLLDDAATRALAAGAPVTVDGTAVPSPTPPEGFFGR
ncbi:MAG TPA: fused MFS/spermidine synthase [Pseudonocardia sp.]|nr:fused MFS/spermidine synthase [Pseudonocardia sp.]